MPNEQLLMMSIVEISEHLYKLQLMMKMMMHSIDVLAVVSMSMIVFDVYAKLKNLVESFLEWRICH